MASEPVSRPSESGDAEWREVITVDVIAESLGDIGDSRMAALIATNATVEEFEEALAWASGESDVMGEMEKRLDGAAALVYDILTLEEQYPEDEPEL